MPHFDEFGGDEWICQGPRHQGNPVQNSRVNSEWRPDITGNDSAGNVCPICVQVFDRENRAPDRPSFRDASPKAPAIDDLLTSFTGKSRIVQVSAGGCMTCETPNIQFKTELDEREYRISGMCQDCQDKVFKVPED